MVHCVCVCVCVYIYTHIHIQVSLPFDGMYNSKYSHHIDISTSKNYPISQPPSSISPEVLFLCLQTFPNFVQFPSYSLVSPSKHFIYSPSLFLKLFSMFRCNMSTPQYPYFFLIFWRVFQSCPWLKLPDCLSHSFVNLNQPLRPNLFYISEFCNNIR